MVSIPGSTLVLGGARAGKSTYAEQLAAAGAAEVTYIATCPRIAGDRELEQRIEQHRADRPTAWHTIEEELDLAGALTRTSGRFVVVDCLTTWVGNHLHHGSRDDDILRATTDAIDTAATAGTVGLAIVSNEVGLGIVPAEAMTRRYRDLLGRVNQRWSAAVEHATLLIAGRALRLDAW